MSLYERNNETETFVEEYPLKKDGEPEIDLSDLSSASEVPLLLQCGKCAEACPEGAITQNPKGVYIINKKKCTGCGACAKACPFGLIM